MSLPSIETASDSTAAVLGTQGFYLRRARREDVPDIIALLIAGTVADAPTDTLDKDARPAYLRAFDLIAASPHEMLFVAELDGKIVGTFQISYCQTLGNRGRMRATLESVHVATDCRGKGIGAKMVAHALDVAREHGAGVLQLTSNKKRVDAHRFYERLGFKRSHEGFKWEF